ncbi:MAG: HNH endonuclease [Gammaproteobacteria bacterium]|nr:HNH endonuclease [Gammaproteobacteria bacterium]
MGTISSKRKRKEVKAKLLRAQGYRCNAPCGDYGRGIGDPLKFKNAHLDRIDHNGPYSIENLQVLCPNCNWVKGNRGMGYLLNNLWKEWAQMQLSFKRQPAVARKQQPQPKRKRLLMLPLLPPPLVPL